MIKKGVPAGGVSTFTTHSFSNFIHDAPIKNPLEPILGNKATHVYCTIFVFFFIFIFRNLFKIEDYSIKTSILNSHKY